MEEKLVGWKRIAGYLEVTRRTAQRFEKEHQLPIHRPGGRGSSVYAYTAELDAWIQRGGMTGGGGSAQFAEPAQHVEVGASARRLGPLLAIAASVLMIVLIGALGVTILASDARGVARVDLDISRNDYGKGNWLTLLTAAGDVIESWEFPNQVTQASLDRSASTPRLVVGFGGGEGRRRGWIAAFAPDREEIWGFNTFDEVKAALFKARGGDHSDHLIVSDLFVNVYRGRSVIVAIAQDEQHWLSRLVLLDAKTGALIGQYWHGGKIGYARAAMFDIDGDGEDEIIVPGFNNLLRARLSPRGESNAVVFAMDLEQLEELVEFQSWPPLFPGVRVELPRWYFLIPQATGDKTDATILPIESDDFDRDGVPEARISTIDRRFYHVNGDGVALNAFGGDRWNQEFEGYEIPMPVAPTRLDIAIDYLWLRDFDAAERELNAAERSPVARIRERVPEWRRRLEVLRRRPPGDRGFLGMYFRQEYRVRLVIDDVGSGPAANAGLLPGDLLLQADGEQIRDLADLLYVLHLRGPGEEIGIVASRDGVEHEFTVVLGSPLPPLAGPPSRK